MREGTHEDRVVVVHPEVYAAPCTERIVLASKRTARQAVRRQDQSRRKSVPEGRDGFPVGLQIEHQEHRGRQRPPVSVVSVANQ